MPNKKQIHIIKSDILTGFLTNKNKYIIVIILFACIVYSINNDISNFMVLNKENQLASITDIWFNLFMGMGEYNPSNGTPFQIPFLWLIIQTVVGFFIINYPSQNLYKYGIQVLTRSQSRKTWWISKCIWNICTVVSVYLIAFLCIFIVLAVNGQMDFIFNQDINNLYNSLDIDIANSIFTYFTIYAMPIITSITVSLIQMLLSFVLTPIYSFILVIAYSIISAYYCSYFFIGNFSMLLRNTLFGIGSIDTFGCVTICASIIVITIIIGLLYFNRLDIIKKVG